MPAALYQSLPAIAFSRNPIPFIVQSSDYQDSVPTYSVNLLKFTGAVTDGQQILLSWENGSVAMTAKDEPDDSGYQFPTGDGTMSYATSLVPWFRGNPALDRDYTVFIDPLASEVRLIITSRVPGAEYDFTETATGNMSVVVDHPGAYSLKPFFMHHLQVWIKNQANTDFEIALNENVALDYPLTGKTSIDVGEHVLHGFLKPDYPVMAQPFAQCLSSIREYYCKYAQIYGTDPSIKRIRETDVAVVTMGGLSVQAAQERDLLSELVPTPLSPELTRFLRQGSKNKMVRIDQPEWLTFLNTTDSSILADLEIVIYNDDESTTTFNAVTALNIQPYEKYQFQAGFTQLDIYSRQAAGKKPLYYTCRLKDETGYKTDTYAYVIDYAYREWPRYFVYFNSYGAYQTIATTGKSFAEYDRTKDDAHVSATRAEAAIKGDFIECNISIREKYTINIGYAQPWKRNTALLRDFLLSPSAFVFENGKLIPIGFNSTNLKDAQDGENVFASSFEYYKKYDEVNYTEPQPQTDESVNELLHQAGAPVTPGVPDELVNGTLIVEYGDAKLSLEGGFQVFTSAYWLTGKVGYRIKATQLGLDGFFRTEDILYNPDNGSFKILLQDFRLKENDQLIIWPFILTA